MSLYINHVGAEDKTSKFSMLGVQLNEFLDGIQMHLLFFSSLNLKERLCGFSCHFCNQSLFSVASFAIFSLPIKYSLRGR